MERTSRQKVVAGGCLAVAALLTIYQFVPGFGHPPLALYLLFTGVWLFGAAMTWWLPLFGAAGTFAYGLLLGAMLLRTHETRWQNVALAGLCFVTAGLALDLLLATWRARRV